MKNEIAEFNKKFTDELLEVGYKHIAVDTAEGERIVSYNQPKQKIEAKFTEITKRLRVLPDGYYRIYCLYSYGSKAKPDMFLIKKGKVEDSLQEAAKSVPQPILPMTKDQTKREEIVSLEQALARIEQMTKLEMENTILKDKVERQAEEIADLESEIAELEEKEPMAEGGMNGIGGWLKEIAPVIAPLADQYFAMQKQKNELLAMRLQQKQKKNPVIVHSHKGRKQRSGQPQKPSLEEIISSIDINNQNVLNQLYDELDAMDEQTFDSTYDVIVSLRPDVAELVAIEFEFDKDLEESEANNDR